MTTELLPCPFCGGKAEIERFGTYKMSTQYACQNCSCHLETGEESDHGARWNERAALAATPDLPAEPDKSQALDGLTGYVAGIIAANERAMPVAAPRAPIAQPLSDAQIDKCWDGLTPAGHGKSRYDIARAIEIEHGIKGEVAQ